MLACQEPLPPSVREFLRKESGKLVDATCGKLCQKKKGLELHTQGKLCPSARKDTPHLLTAADLFLEYALENKLGLVPETRRALAVLIHHLPRPCRGGGRGGGAANKTRLGPWLAVAEDVAIKHGVMTSWFDDAPVAVTKALEAIFHLAFSQKSREQKYAPHRPRPAQRGRATNQPESRLPTHPHPTRTLIGRS